MEVLTKTPSYPFGKTYEGYKNKIYQKEVLNHIIIHRVKIIEGYNSSIFRKISNYIVNALIASFVALRIGRRFDKVFIYQTGPLTFALPGALIHKFYKKKTVIWTQDLWPDTVFSYGFKKSKFNEKILNSFVRFIYRHMDTALVTSRSFVESLKITTRNKKEFYYVPQWALVKQENHKKGKIQEIWDKNKFHFTFTGNIGKVQNLDNVIEAFAQVSEKYPDKLQLNIIGDGSHLANLKKKVEKERIINVVFHGRKPLDEMNNYYGASNILIISLNDDPSFNKYIPAKFQSYLTSGKPIFAVMSGEVKNLVKKYNLGWTAPPGDVSAIAKKIEEIYFSPPEEFKNKGQNTKRLLETEFNREKIIEKIKKYF